MASDNEREPLIQSVNSNENVSNYGSSSRELNLPQTPVQTSVHLLPAILILVFVLLERIAYYSLSGNLYLFLHQAKLHWMYYNAISALLIFTGISYLSSLFGGWLSDAYLGRFKTIGLAFVIFTAAYWILPLIASNINTVLGHICPITEPFVNLTNSSNVSILPSDFPLYKESCCWSVMPVLIIAAIGTGVVKANITPFGADQVRYFGQDGLRLYLNWLYWCVNIGALIAVLGITYIQQEKGFTEGYIVPAALLSVATLLFWIAYPLYACHSPPGSAISRTFGVLKEAWKSNRVAKENSSIIRLSHVNKPSWLDMAKVRYGGKFHESVVEDVKSLSTIMKVFIILIPYWMLYFQMQGTFLAQGLQMRLSLIPSNSSDSRETEKFSIPAAWLMLFNVVFLIIFIPLMNHVIYPCLNKRGVQISMLNRMAIGMLCAASSMVVAGYLEWKRLSFVSNHQVINQTIENETYLAADLSILWQIPQYSLIGISEVFTSVSGMEFACSQAPNTMQGAVMGFYYFCTGVGSFLGVATLEIYEQLSKVSIKPPSNDINGGKLYCYFFFLALIQFVTLVPFYFISKRLKVRKLPTVESRLGSVLRSLRGT